MNRNRGRGREQGQVGRTGSRKTKRSQKIRSMINTEKYFIPKNATIESISVLLNHPHAHGVPLKADIIQRLRTGGYPVNRMALFGNNQTERELPERRIVEDFEELANDQRAANGPDTMDPSHYSNAFLYEVVHHIFYLKSQPPRYLPFFGTTPNREWIMNMLLGYDPQDKLTLRIKFDADQVLKSLEGLKEADVAEVNRLHPNLLRLPAPGNQVGFIEDMNGILSCVPLLQGNVKNTVRRSIKDILSALHRMTITLHETDFNLTRFYTELLDIQAEINKGIREAGIVHKPSNLPLYLFGKLSHLSQQLLAMIPSKTLTGQNLVTTSERHFLETTCKETYSALCYCMGAADGMANTFNIGLRAVPVGDYLERVLQQDQMSIAACSTISSLDSRMQYCIQNQLNQLNAQNIVGIVGGVAFDRFRRQIRDSITGSPEFFDRLRAHCTNLRQGQRFGATLVFSQKYVIRMKFLLAYGYFEGH